MSKITVLSPITNVKASVINYLKLQWVPCFAHSLQLAIKKTLNNAPASITTSIATCKTFVNKFNRSTKLYDELRKIQNQVEEEELLLINDVPTKWNSTYLLLFRLTQLKSSILELAKNRPDWIP
eukprot:TRINITY_DN1989_c0_g3_i1.p1 TRINITY_DN1989_c0_g3~~TRINITY_DN1989_c0_g3_i1.p1  ORF type:complete len:141 (+),score=14.17 TRINITY_DN1989_c0_g3_i1:54-425(+)